VTEVTVMHKMISYGYWDLATDTPTRQYRIIVSGHLGAVGREAFRDFRIEPHGTDTALTGELNRSGLFDTLARLRDLGPGSGPGRAYLPGSLVRRRAPD